MESKLEEYFKECIPEPLSEQQFKKFKSFITFHRDLCLHERDGFENNEISCRLFDAKVDAKGPDDKIYGSKRGIVSIDKIRDEITRGCILLEITNKKNKNEKIFKIFQGFCKFSGLTDQDDDDLAKMSKRNDQEVIEKDLFFLDSTNKANKIVKMVKENGKAAHFACFEFNKKKYFVAGSKNVHVVFQNAKDMFGSRDKHTLHVKIGRHFLDMLNIRMEKESRDEFLNMLCKTEFLCNFEIMLDGDQHIVDYKFDRLGYILKFLTFTGRRTNNSAYKKKFGKLFPVDLGLKYAKGIGLNISPFVEVEYSGENMQKLITDVRKEEDTEGSVFYFIDESGMTLGLSKVKSVWYVMWRAIREKVKRKHIKDYDSQIKNRFRNIQGWLNLSDDEVKRWRIIAWKFNIFMKKQLIYKQGKKNKTHNTLSSGYPVYVKKFLEGFTMPEDLDEEVENIPVKSRSANPHRATKSGKKSRKKSKKSRKRYY